MIDREELIDLIFDAMDDAMDVDVSLRDLAKAAADAVLTKLSETEGN